MIPPLLQETRILSNAVDDVLLGLEIRVQGLGFRVEG